MNEAKIVKKCQHGNMEEFALLYDGYVDKIYRFIYYKTMHKQTAEDLVSQTFFKAMENIDKFNPDKGTFSSWLYRVARNNVIDHYRTSKNIEDIDDIWGLSTEEDIEVDLDVKDKLEQVKKYLDKVKPDHREIVAMKLWDQLSYKEIAAITGKTVANCKMTFSRVMVKLREELAFTTASLILLITNLFQL